MGAKPSLGNVVGESLLSRAIAGKGITNEQDPRADFNEMRPSLEEKIRSLCTIISDSEDAGEFHDGAEQLKAALQERISAVRHMPRKLPS